MNKQRNFLLFALFAAAATPALAQTAPPVAAPAGSATHDAASIPDFSRVWAHPALPWYEPPASGPGPITNRSRGPQRPSGISGSQASPPLKEGVSNYDQLVGDYTSPLLQPWAAEIVKKFGEISLAGITYPNPSNQCWPHPMPFVFKHFQVQIIQQPDKVLFLYNEDHEVRRVRLNEPHRSPLTPSWYGDSVGHYEGVTLVIDTVGFKVGPVSMVDRFGTPHTEALHVVERCRLLDYEAAKEGMERDARENQVAVGTRDMSNRGKYLQLLFTVEDEGAFTMPWSATITYGRPLVEWPEHVCAENTQWFPGQEAAIPTAAKPDF